VSNLKYLHSSRTNAVDRRSARVLLPFGILPAAARFYMLTAVGVTLEEITDGNRAKVLALRAVETGRPARISPLGATTRGNAVPGESFSIACSDLAVCSDALRALRKLWPDGAGVLLGPVLFR
jgi:hypothetical protein